ncbi:hypothetical protein BDP67DRAFT_524504 [Colletotrichum lupini]|nr:hypothetical protein BDP67DRAFT_524504 [Colletotrichum lupini]
MLDGRAHQPRVACLNTCFITWSWLQTFIACLPEVSTANNSFIQRWRCGIFSTNFITSAGRHHHPQPSGRHL